MLDLGGHGRHEAWQAEQLGRELDDVSLAAAGSTGLMTLTDLRILLARRLAGRPTRTSFRTGALTLCTLTPMRSVPHKVICLLGMDDAAFPRHGLPDGDDFLARSPRDGERDPRREDRQLFLDALLAAEHTLVVTYSGFDVRTGVRLPPAVPVGELLDALELTAPGARQHVVVEHPLQPFDPRNFTPGDLGEPGPLSFDRQACDGAHALRTAGTARVPFLTAPLAAPVGEEAVVALNTLREFWQHPAKGFLRQRLGVDSTTAEDEPSDALLLELTGLQAWAVGDRLLRLRMGGTPGAQARAAESARGALPPAVFGEDLLNGIDAEVTALAQACSTYWAAPTPLEFDLPVSGSATLNGTVVFRGGQILSVGYSKLGPKPRLRAWLDLLAAAVATGRPTCAVVIGRGPKPDAPAVETYHVNDPDVASDLLADLLRVRQIGMCTPLALPLKAGEAYARARSTGSGSVEAREKSARKWEGGFDYAGEDAEAEHRLVWGPDATFDVLTGWSCPLPLELPGDEHGDFARLASWLWAPILAAEVTS